MASGLFNRAIKEILDRTLDITSGCKVMLLATGYTYDPDTDFVSSGAGTIGATELAATNYTAGFGGAGRKATTITFAEQDANDRAVVLIADLTWTALGGASNGTIVAAVLIKEGTSDADSKVIAYFDVTDTATNGGDITLGFDGVNGNIRISA